MCNGAPFTVEKILSGAGIELGTARSVGQRLTHWATGAPIVIEKYICASWLVFSYEQLGPSFKHGFYKC